MKSPLERGRKWLHLEEVGSTQDVAASLVLDDSPYGIVLAKDQKTGRGRMSRQWVSTPGESLTMSLIFREYVDHPAPHLIGMSVAIAAAGVIHSHLQWPNDLTIKKRKVGGLITELKPNAHGELVPIVGIGINLNQSEFPPEISDRAISLFQDSGAYYDANELAERILARMKTLPEPDSWSNVYQTWRLFDATPGKIYRLPSGEESTALGLGPNGELICTVDGTPHSVIAADAIFGVAP